MQFSVRRSLLSTPCCAVLQQSMAGVDSAVTAEPFLHKRSANARKRSRQRKNRSKTIEGTTNIDALRVTRPGHLDGCTSDIARACMRMSRISLVCQLCGEFSQSYHVYTPKVLLRALLCCRELLCRLLRCPQCHVIQHLGSTIVFECRASPFGQAA